MQATFFKANRQSLKQARQGLFCITAYTSMQRANDTAFFFNQEGNFWYLTGITQPDWIVIIDTTTDEEWLIAPDKDSIHEIFDGTLPHEKAAEISGVKKVVTYNEGIRILRALAKKHSIVHTINNPPYADRFNFTLNPALSLHSKMLGRIFNQVIDCQNDIARLRAVKNSDEINAMQLAIDRTIEGFTRAKQTLVNVSYEYELEAEFTYYFKKHGGADHAYDPIIASGKNACTLHYVDNHTKIGQKDLILLDVGAKVEGYCADITRTFCKTVPSKRKQAVHAAVVAAQREVISLLKPNLLVEDYVRECDRIMKQALMSLDLLREENDSETYRRYFPHAMSHGLGIDVHDSLGSPRYFQEGMVLTVEPGIYIPEEGIGVRIEDDILITADGHRNMSAKLSTDL